MKKDTLNRLFSLVASISLLANCLLSPFAIAYAQEATPSTEPTQIVESTPTASPEESPVLTSTPENTQESTPTPVIDATPSPEVVVSSTPVAEVILEPSTEATPTAQPEDQAPTTTAPPEVSGESTEVSPTPTITTTSDEKGEISAFILKDTKASSIDEYDLTYQAEGSATITTDKLDYAPTDAVLVTGSGFIANKTYKIIISSSDDPAVTHEEKITADSEGKIIYSYQLDGNYRPNYKVVAKDVSGQIIDTVTFTDSVTTTAATGGTNISADKAANSTSPSGGTYTTLGNIVITEGSKGDFTATTTLTLNAPLGWTFKTSGVTTTVTGDNPQNVTVGTIIYSSTVITIPLTVGNTDKTDIFTIIGVGVKASDGANVTGAGNITSGSTALINNLPNGTNLGSLSQVAGAFYAAAPKSTLDVDNMFAVANDVDQITATITAKDQFGNPLSGLSANLLSTGTGDTFVTNPATTNAIGVASIAIKSTKAEHKTLSATVGGTTLIQTLGVDFYSGSVSTITVSPDTATVESSYTQAFTATSVDAFGNPISETYIWSVNSGTGTATINSSGVLTAVNPGTVTVTATGTTTSDTSGTITIPVITPPIVTSAKVISSNQVTLVFNEPVNCVAGDFTNLEVWGTKTVDTISGSGTNTIVLTFSGGSVWTNATGTVDLGAGIVSVDTSTSLTPVTRPIADGQNPTASITYSNGGEVHAGQWQYIEAHFSEDMSPGTPVKIALAGANVVAATDMIRTTSQEYRYDHLVGAGDGTVTVSFSVGTDTSGNAITAIPTSGATFGVDNTGPRIETPGFISLRTDPGADGKASIGDTIRYTNGSVFAGDSDTWTVDLSAYGLSATAAPDVEYTIVADNDNDVVFSASETVTDNGGNTASGPVAIWMFTNIDNVAPTQTISGIDISADTGTSDSDFLTDTASQTITATLSSSLGASDILYGSVNNGANWTDITSKVSGTAISWDGATLSGNSSIAFKITDAARNAGTTIAQSYILDATAPTVTVNSPAAGSYFGVTVPMVNVSFLDNLILNLAYYNFDGGVAWQNIFSNLGSNSGTYDIANQSLWNSLTEGLHNLFFRATDTAGNTFETPSGQGFAVGKDTTPPVITLLGANPQTIEVGGSYTELNATAADNYDGDITGNISIDAGSVVNPNVINSYIVSYNVTDTHGNAAITATRTVNVVDTTAPTVTKVDTTHANGAFKVGEEIDITLTYSEPVTVIGGPVLGLNSSGVANYLSGSGTDTLTFRYTVNGGENSNDLDYESTYSLSLVGGSIKDTALNNADNTLPAVGTFAAVHAIVIDTVAPSYSWNLPAVDSVYADGQPINVEVNITDAISGIENGADCNAIVHVPPISFSGSVLYSSATGKCSGTITLYKPSYLPDGFHHITLQVADKAGNSEISSEREIVIDNTAPTIATVTTTTVDGAYTVGQVIDFSVTFSEPVDVGGTDIDFALNSGPDRKAVYAPGSGSTNMTSLNFLYTVGIDDGTSDLSFIDGSITLNGGATIEDASGNDANLTLPSQSAFELAHSIVIDTTPPVITLNDGLSSFVVVYGSTFTDAGATTNDGSSVTVGGDTITSISPVGTYHVTYDAVDSAGNHATQVTRTVNITKANATIIVTTYLVTYDGDPHSATGSATGVETTPADLSGLLHLGGTTHTNAGTYNADAWTFDGNDNYNPASGTVRDIIARANATIVITNYNGVYDAVAHGVTGTATGVKGESLTGLDLGATYTDVPGGFPHITFTDLTGNYNSDATNASVNITKKEITIAATVGQSKVFGTADPVSFGFNPSEELFFSGKLGRTAGEDVGAYDYNLNTLSAGSNYSLTLTPDTFVITQAGLTVTANNITNEYGDSDQTFAFAYTGFVNNEDSSVIDTPPTCTVSVSHSAVGTYPITCSGGIDNNYSFGYVDGTLTVQDTTAPTAPIATPAGGNYSSDQTVSITAETSAEIRYTTDGTIPTNSTGTIYTGTILIGVDTVIKAVAIDASGNISPVMTEIYGMAPVISGQSGLGTGYDTATITWFTDRLATSRVIYDTVSHPFLDSEPNYGYAWSTGTNNTDPKVLDHTVYISGLSSGTLYYYRTISTGSPTTLGGESTFRTLSIPGAPAPSDSGVLGTSIVAVAAAPWESWRRELVTLSQNETEGQVLPAQTEAPTTLGEKTTNIVQNVAQFAKDRTKITLGIGLGILLIIGLIVYISKKENK